MLHRTVALALAHLFQGPEGKTKPATPRGPQARQRQTEGLAHVLVELLDLVDWLPHGQTRQKLRYALAKGLKDIAFSAELYQDLRFVTQTGLDDATRLARLQHLLKIHPVLRQALEQQGIQPPAES